MDLNGRKRNRTNEKYDSRRLTCSDRLCAPARRSFAGTTDTQKECSTSCADFFSEMVQTILDLEAKANTNWRLRASLLGAFPGLNLMGASNLTALRQHLPRFPNYFSNEAIYDKFLPVVLQNLETGVPQVRSAAADAIASFFRYVK
eukprot:scaffold246902_cov43-Prasinocladus_malaysianus.AAC.4